MKAEGGEIKAKGEAVEGSGRAGRPGPAKVPPGRERPQEPEGPARLPGPGCAGRQEVSVGAAAATGVGR